MRKLPLLLLLAAAAAAQPADLILHNGKIVTLDTARPQITALAARGGRITAVGGDAEVRKQAGPQTRVIDLKGALAIPGFIEGHGHFTGIGRQRMQLNLRIAQTWDDVVGIVQVAAKNSKPGEWILGRGWHQSHWEKPPQPQVEGFPVHEALSRVSPNNPVWLTHGSGHAGFANAKAMELAGITAKTPNPPGGEILRDANGNPTGLMRERAQGLVSAALGKWERSRSAAEREKEARREIELAAAECLRKGITTVHDAGAGPATVDLMKKMIDERKLGVRLWVMLRGSSRELAGVLDRYRIQDYGDHHLTVRAIKRSIDGALGPRGAWLLEPYSDLPSGRGFNTDSVDDVRAVAELAIAKGFQLCVHAIGDRANRETLDIFDQTFRKNPDKKDLRWRIEHAQHLDPADIPRFAKLGVIASMQGVHCTQDAAFVLERLGPRRAEAGAYVWRKLLDSGAVVTNGTDAPVEDVDPIASFYSTVTRRRPNGDTFYPAQKMTRMEALRSYTLSNAYAAFEESHKGSLATGKLADVTVLSRDILTVPDAEIPKAQVLYTIVGGQVKYEKK